MNLYLISQTVNDDYDTYDSAVVAAESEETARQMHPRNGEIDAGNQYGSSWDSWAEPKNVQVELLGTAKDGMQRGLVCSSFNAG